MVSRVAVTPPGPTGAGRVALPVEKGTALAGITGDVEVEAGPDLGGPAGAVSVGVAVAVAVDDDVGEKAGLDVYVAVGVREGVAVAVAVFGAA